MILHLKDEDFNKEIEKDLVLVDFYADWCGPCRMLSPLIEELAEENNNVKVIKVNVDEREDVARNYAVMSIPTLLLFEDGEIKKKQIGFMSKDELEDWVK